MSKLVSVLWAALAAFLVWTHANPVIVSAVVLGGVGLLSRLAPKHPRLQGLLDVLAGMGFDIDKIGRGVVRLLTGASPQKDGTNGNQNEHP